MSELLTTFAPIVLFMLIPVWIPLISVGMGEIFDRLRPAVTTPAEEAVLAAKARSAHARLNAGLLLADRRARSGNLTHEIDVPDSEAA